MDGGTTTLYDGFNIDAPGANTPIISGGLDMSEYKGVCAISVWVVLETASVFNLTVTRGATKKTIGILESATLNANDGYGPFLIPVTSLDTVNFEIETDGVIARLYVEGVYSGVR